MIKNILYEKLFLIKKEKRKNDTESLCAEVVLLQRLGHEGFDFIKGQNTLMESHFDGIMEDD